MWPFTRTLKSVLSETKKVKIKGVRFEIRKLSPKDYLSGSKVMIQYFDTYKAGKVPSETNIKKVQQHYKDVFLAAVISPKLDRKDDGSGFFVDELFLDWDLCNRLYSVIMEYTIGKKKPDSFKP